MGILHAYLVTVYDIKWHSLYATKGIITWKGFTVIVIFGFCLPVSCKQ